MATLNSKTRATFEEWLEDIDNNDLKLFVFANSNEEVDFGSDDFKLVHTGISDGDPVNCHMIEARINGKTKDKQLKKLFRTSGSLASIQTRLAFALVPTSVNGYCTGQHVRQTLRESPVEGKTAVNKVHVKWNPSVKWAAGKTVVQCRRCSVCLRQDPLRRL